MNPNIFVTGATGFVGQKLLVGLLQREPLAHFWLLVRKSQQATAPQRFQTLLASAAQEAGLALDTVTARCQLVEGDLELPKYGLTDAAFLELARQINVIFHSAANVILEQPIERSRQMNLTGTLTALELGDLAMKHGGLERFNHVSTAYVAGRREGLILEEELDCGQEFNNSYEQVKLEGERAVRQAMARFPVTVFRPSMIMGDSQTGWTNSFNVLYAPIKMGYFGKLRVVPGCRKSRIDTVPIDFIAKSLVYLSSLKSEVIGKTFHLTVGPGRGISVEELHVTCHRHLEEWVNHYNLKNPRVIPAIIHPYLFRALTFAAMNFSWGAHRRIFQRFAAFTSYTLYYKDFDTTQAKSLLEPAGIICPRLVDYLPVICKYCVETHFGTANGPRDVT